MATKPRSRVVVLRGLTVVLAAGLVFGLFEATAFLWPARHALDNPWYTFTGTDAQIGSRDLPFERPPHFSWTGSSRGDLAVLNGDEDPYARRVTFRTDHEGFRNGEDIHKAEIVFIGDSFTEAGNLPEDESFVHLVGAVLGRTVRNLGRAGYAPPHELIVIGKYGLRCDPRTVIWQIAESNDLYDSQILEEWKAAGRPYAEFERQSRPTRVEVWKRRSLVYRYLVRRGEGRPWPLAGTFRDSFGRDHEMRFLEAPSRKHTPRGHPAQAVFADALKNGVELLQSRGIDVVVLLIPMKIRVHGSHVRWNDSAHTVLREEWEIPEEATLAHHLGPFVERLGARFVDATPALRAHAARGDLVYQPMDTHLSTRGHEVLAELIVKELATEDLAR